MQREAKLSSKGQVTIPVEIRRALRLKGGDTLVFEADHRGVHLRPHWDPDAFARHEGIFREGEGKSLEEILAETREMRGDIE